MSRNVNQLRYPHLYALLEEVALDNELSLNNDGDWGDYLSGLDYYEGRAAMLTPEDRETLAVGEYDDAMAIARQYGVEDLHDFIGECFDGQFAETFFDYL